MHAWKQTICCEAYLFAGPPAVYFADGVVGRPRASGYNAAYTFDRRFPSDGVEVLREAP